MSGVGHVGGPSSVGFGAMIRGIAGRVGNLRGRVVRTLNNLSEGLRNLSAKIANYTKERHWKMPPPTSERYPAPTALPGIHIPTAGYTDVQG